MAPGEQVRSSSRYQIARAQTFFSIAEPACSCSWTRRINIGYRFADIKITAIQNRNDGRAKKISA
jgi:hypothetical protein